MKYLVAAAALAAFYLGLTNIGHPGGGFYANNGGYPLFVHENGALIITAFAALYALMLLGFLARRAQ